jgi:ribosomal-protein-alanine N-acetyltransferase
MGTLRVATDRLELTPLPGPAAAGLPDDRAGVERALAAQLSPEWPDPSLFGVLARHASGPADAERFGVWVIIERRSATVVGDIGFHGPPDDEGVVEIGYSVVPSRRRRGYANEAAAALVAWARAEPGVRGLVAGCEPGNLASIATLERAGFQRTGEANGELRWRYAGPIGQLSAF